MGIIEWKTNKIDIENWPCLTNSNSFAIISLQLFIFLVNEPGQIVII